MHSFDPHRPIHQSHSASFIATQAAFVHHAPSQLLRRQKSFVNSHSSRAFSKSFHSLPLIRSPHVRCHSPRFQPICNAQTDPTKANSGVSEKNSEHVTSDPESFRRLRKILAGLAFLGIAETSYLTANKLFSSPGAICSTQGCLEVLTGPFSAIFGIPLSLFGVLFYAIFAYLCIWPLAAVEEEEDVDSRPKIIPAVDIYASRDAVTRPLMLAVATTMMVFSAYLMGLLFLVIQSICPYCLISAGLSVAIFGITAFGGAVPKLKTALTIGGMSTAAAGTAAALMFFVSLPGHIRAQPPGEPASPPEITMRSSPDSMRIANKLGQKKAKMYGAYWCTHCFDQKQRFGKKAFGKLEYIECDKHGANTKFQLCREKRIPGYPTWEIDGEMYPGEIDISELERLVDEASKSQ